MPTPSMTYHPCLRSRLSRLAAAIFPALYCRWYSPRCDHATGYHYELGYLDGKGPLHDAWLAASARHRQSSLSNPERMESSAATCVTPVSPSKRGR